MDAARAKDEATAVFLASFYPVVGLSALFPPWLNQMVAISSTTLRRLSFSLENNRSVRVGWWCSSLPPVCGRRGEPLRRQLEHASHMENKEELEMSDSLFFVFTIGHKVEWIEYRFCGVLLFCVILYRPKSREDLVSVSDAPVRTIASQTTKIEKIFLFCTCFQRLPLLCFTTGSQLTQTLIPACTHRADVFIQCKWLYVLQTPTYIFDSRGTY